MGEMDILTTRIAKEEDPYTLLNAEHLPLGNIWECFEVIDEDDSSNSVTVENVIAATLNYGECVENGYKITKGKKTLTGHYFKLTCPDDALVSPVVVTAAMSKDEEAVETIVPYIDGKENEGTITAIKPYKNGVEAEIVIDLGDIEIACYLHYYAKIADIIKVGDKIQFRLSAIALNMRYADTTPLRLDSGVAYEMTLESFLKENPDKTKADLPYIEFDTSGIRILIPRENSSTYEFRGQTGFYFDNAFSVTRQGAMADVEIYKDPEGNDISARIFTNAKSFDGELPQFRDGESVEGIGWFMAEIIAIEREDETVHLGKLIDFTPEMREWLKKELNITPEEILQLKGEAYNKFWEGLVGKDCEIAEKYEEKSPSPEIVQLEGLISHIVWAVDEITGSGGRIAPVEKRESCTQ